MRILRKRRLWLLVFALLATAAYVHQAMPPPFPTQADASRDGVERRSYSLPGSPIKISYLRNGDVSGRRVIFVHGTPGSAIQFERYLAAVPKDAEFIAIDRPGFGQSNPDMAVTSLSEQAKALQPLLVERKGAWPILVGHSLGGPIVARAAVDNPGKVGGLLILAGAFDPQQEHVYAIQNVADWAWVRDLLPTMLRNANQELIALKPQLEILAPRLIGIGCTVSVIHGTKDANVPYANVAFIKAHYSAARLTVQTIPGQGHFLPEFERTRIVGTLARLLKAAPKPC